MKDTELDVVTGAFSFTGKYITRRLLAVGNRVKTLTGHPDRNHPFGEAVPAAPFNFENPAALTASLAGATTLYNTYWIRFERGQVTFDRAVANTKVLLKAAREAGLRRIVHISIARADEHSPFPYYRAKKQAERAVRESGLSWVIVRPTVLFGKESILFNNIAWLLRRFPVFAVPSSGRGLLQPVHVDDVAELAVEAGQGETCQCIEAAGPEVFAYDEVVGLIAKTIGSHARLLRVKPQRLLQFTRLINGLVHDVLLTADEIEALTHDLLVSPTTPSGHTAFSRWIKRHADTLGTSYHSELARHFD
jgi:NADH dehydrogenase